MKFNKRWLSFGVAIIAVLTYFGVNEYIAIFDGDIDTWTLTATVITYIPQEIFWIFGLGLVGFTGWFVHHFYTYYRK